jgi:hypothetical protein
VPRDFYGEADQEVTAVTPVPDGMVCGGLSVGNGLTVQTSEPAGGFTGACLMNRAYGGGLPSVCYSPSPATYTTGDPGHTVQCTVPAANVAQPYWYVDVQQQPGKVTRQSVARLRTLETCAPHLGSIDPACHTVPPEPYQGPNEDNPNGDCPCGTKLVSHSCCTFFGQQLSSSDGQTATGTAYFVAH